MAAQYLGIGRGRGSINALQRPSVDYSNQNSKRPDYVKENIKLASTSIQCECGRNIIAPAIGFDSVGNINRKANFSKSKRSNSSQSKSSHKNDFNSQTRSHQDNLSKLDVPKISQQKFKNKNSFIPNDDDEEYQLRVNRGIFFDNYDNVDVEVFGKDIPPPISSIDDIQMPEFLRNNLINIDFKKLTPVQKYSIPILDANRDMIACAQTGSGKTVAFLVPIIRALSRNLNLRHESIFTPQCIIISPTRELCRQIFTIARLLCGGSTIRCAYMYGGVASQTLAKMDKSGIIVATPVMVARDIERGIIDVSKLKFFVLDEADKLITDSYFIDAINTISAKVNHATGQCPQIAMFSATFPPQIQRMAETMMKNHLFVTVGMIGSACVDIDQQIISVTDSTRVPAFMDYLKNNKTGKCLIFVSSRNFAEYLADRMNQVGMSVTAIHSLRDQESREKALNQFKSGRVENLVATDVAARGLDIPNVETVINVQMPYEMDLYVHRIGRTGRCGNPGRSVTFFNPDNDKQLAAGLITILQNAGKTCPDWLKILAQPNRSSLKEIKDNFMNCADECLDEDFFNCQ